MSPTSLLRGRLTKSGLAFGAGAALVGAFAVASLSLRAAEAADAPDRVSWRAGPGQSLEATLDAGGRLAGLESRAGTRRISWIEAAPRLAQRNEATGDVSTAGLRERVTSFAGGLAWDISIAGDGPRAGRELACEIDLLSSSRSIFTPGERGVVSLAQHPTAECTPYAAVGYGTGRSTVLPLVGVFDRERDLGLTLALPPEPAIPDFRISWKDARTLRLVLGHRAAGGGRDATIRILLFGHEADYRSSIRAYSEAFPEYFRSPMPRGPGDGAFWYHHIHDHPDFEEMARQRVRFIWASFWFTHLGDYLPDAPEWEPYTFACAWKLAERMSDAKIRAFAHELRERDMGLFAYFNITEYGGSGGRTGSAEEAARRLRERFAAALVKDAKGNIIPTWEGAVAVNPGRAYPLAAVLREEWRKHLERLPEIEGFCVDRLDWASAFDYAHSDGVTMLGDREAENLAAPVAECLGDLVAAAHAAGKRVLVNQFWRVEVLRGVDGYCHEYDFPRGLGYLAPYRPVSAWHAHAAYRGDLLRFEAQLKERLQFAVFPQFIAREFPVSQQAPDPEAAALLEVFAPLFSFLRGKEQVLSPHPIEVEGPNDANLFRTSEGRLVAPISSRLRFLARGDRGTERVRVRLSLERGDRVEWARVASADAPTMELPFHVDSQRVELTLPSHGTTSILVLGSGAPPAEDPEGDAIAKAARERLGPPTAPERTGEGRPRHEGTGADRPRLEGRFENPGLSVSGRQLGYADGVRVSLEGRPVGSFAGSGARFEVTSPVESLPAAGPAVEFSEGTEGTWFLPDRVRLLGSDPEGQRLVLAEWRPADGVSKGSTRSTLGIRLGWTEPTPLGASAALHSSEAGRGGAWRGREGTLAAWIAGREAPEPRQGFALSLLEGQAHTWAESTDDPRVLERASESGESRSNTEGNHSNTEGRPSAESRPSTCWFGDARVAFAIEPPAQAPYRLTAYLLDSDRNGRAADLRLLAEDEVLDSRRVSREETREGVRVSWIVKGPVTLEVLKLEGHNVVVSGIFVDPER